MQPHSDPRAAPAPALPPAPVFVPVTAFDQLRNSDVLWVVGELKGKQEHLFRPIRLKVTEADGQEVLLRVRGNLYFNFGLYLAGTSWVRACYRLVTPGRP